LTFVTMSSSTPQELLNMIGVTHAGTYCLLCNTNFPSHLWRRHFNRNHPDISLPKKINNIAKILNHKIYTVLSTEDPSRYRADNKIYNTIQCSTCNGIFRDRHQHQNHINSIHNLCGEFTPPSIVTCYRLLCGRLFPIHPPSIVNNNPHTHSQQPLKLPSTTMMETTKTLQTLNL
jgi:hypothetical protein